jgi:Membrane domain of glycerophosphoryl diester phosphodiesterase
MEAIELRPLSLGELLDRAFTLYRSHFWLFVGIMAIPSSLAIPTNFFLLKKQGSPLASLTRTTPQAQAAIFSVAFLALLCIFWIAHAIALGAATHAVAEAYLGRQTTVSASYGSLRGRVWRLLGVIFNVGLRIAGILVLVIFVAAMGAGVFVAATPGLGQTSAGIIAALFMLVAFGAGFALVIYLALRYAVAVPAMLLEDLHVFAAIRRSVQLTAGYRGRLFIAAFLMTFIGYVGVMVFQGPFWIAAVFAARYGNWPAWLNFATAASGAIGGAITGPLLMIVLVLSYYDARIRKEAFDLQFLMSSLDHPAPPPGTVTAA